MWKRRDSRREERRASAERQIDDELTFHRERTLDELVEQGWSAPDAEAEARRRFGPAARHRARLVALECRRQSGDRRRASMALLRTSVRAVVRGFGRSPGFTFGVIAILTLGLGVNAITFGMVDRLVLNGPAGVERAHEVRRAVIHRQTRDGAALATIDLAYMDYRDFLHATQLAGVAAESATSVLSGSGESARTIQARLVTANYFSLLGVQPAVGRFFTARESEQEGARLAVLSHAFWQQRYGGDPAVVGQQLPIETDRYTIVGVAPKYFTGSAVARVDVFLPLEGASDLQVAGPWRTSRNFSWIGVIARVGAGVPVKAAAAELTALHQQAYAEAPGANRGGEIELAPLNAVRGATADGELGIAALIGGVALLVMLIAFANVANLFLARSLRHHDEIGVRLALGGSRRRLVAEQATEGALIALCGVVVAVLVAVFGAQPAQTLLFPHVAWLETPINVRILVFLAGCAVIGGGAAAALPMWQAGGVDLVRWLRTGGQRVSRTRTQGAMLLVQGALSALLLVGAGLFVRSLSEAQSLNLGLDTGRLLVVSTVHGDTPPHADFQARLRDVVERIPGVERTTRVAGTTPFVSSWATRLVVPGLVERPRVDDGGPYLHVVEPGYFETVGTSVIEGRSFGDADRDGAPRVAIVNRTMARMYWPGQPAIGKCLQIGTDNPPCSTVVGIVENTRRQQIIEGDSLLYYIPLEQAPPPLRTGGRLIVRAVADDADMLARIAETTRREALALAPGLRHVSARPLDDVISPQLRAWRLGAVLFSAFGLLALTVAAIGLYSVVAFDVEGRRREIGVRTALGASSSAILRLIVGDGMRLAAGGVAVGLVLAWLLAPLLAGLLYGVPPQDARVFAAVAVVLGAAALVASSVPAFRAARMQPGRALRDD